MIRLISFQVNSNAVVVRSDLGEETQRAFVNLFKYAQQFYGQTVSSTPMQQENFSIQQKIGIDKVFFNIFLFSTDTGRVLIFHVLFTTSLCGFDIPRCNPTAKRTSKREATLSKVRANVFLPLLFKRKISKNCAH